MERGSEEVERINAELKAADEWIKAKREDTKSEARKWTDFVAKNLVFMNAGAAVAVLTFLGTAQLWSYGWASWSLVAIALVAFALGAFLPQLTALGNLYGAQWNDEQIVAFYDHSRAFTLKLSTPPPPRDKSEFHKTWQGKLSKHAGHILCAAMVAFWVGVLLGMGSLFFAFAPTGAALP